MKVSFYINEINKVYRDIRTKYESIFAEIDRINADEQKLHKSAHEYSAEGLRQRRDELKQKKQKLTDELETLDSEWKEKTAAIRQDCEKTFSSRFGATPAKVDPKALALLDSGLLTDKELLDLSRQYADNNVMSRFIGHAIEKKGNETGNSDFAAIGAALKLRSQAQPHLELLDGFTALASNGIRAGVSTGDVEGARIASDGYNEQLYPEHLAKYTAEGEEITN